MKTKNIKIKEFTIDLPNYMIINDINNNKYYIEIKNGSVQVDIKTDQKVIVGLNYLEENDIIKIKYYENYENNKNNLIIKKIYIRTKYNFNSESSDDLEFYT